MHAHHQTKNALICTFHEAFRHKIHVPSSSVRQIRGSLSGPGPTTVEADTVMRYWVHFSNRCSSTCCSVAGIVGSSMGSSSSLPPSDEPTTWYSTLYLARTPFWLSTGGGRQLTSRVVELVLLHLMSWGGAEGSGEVERTGRKGVEDEEGGKAGVKNKKIKRWER